MDKLELEVDKRDVLGKKVRFLRRQGITPINLFGHGIQSVALQAGTAELEKLLENAGKSKLIGLKIDESKKSRHVLLRELQRDPLSGELLHMDFYQVKSKEKATVEVPVVLVGAAPALRSKDNMLLHEFESLPVECLPAKIPASIALDISCLTEAETAIRGKDIQMGPGVSILNDPELVVAKISSRRVKEVEEEVVAEEAVGAPEEVPAPKEEGETA